MITFPELFRAILTADKDESRQAARGVRKFLYSSNGKSKDDYKNESRDIKDIINRAPGEYAKIAENWRQENFVIAISVIYYLHDEKQNQPDFLFPWLFNLLQHKNGNVRHAAVRMIDHEMGTLTVHLRFPGERLRFSELSAGDADRILAGLFVNLQHLEASSRKPAYRKYKYISSLLSGTYKSAQILLSHLEDDCGEEYLDRLANGFM